ncbi:MAG: biotin transporter BioY [Haloarculaceae archaeon]
MSTQRNTVDLVGDQFVRNLARACLFAALMGAFAFVSFPNPFSPAPVTLQVLGVFLAGIMLGPVWGGVALAFYLVAGALGAPIFANASAGLGVLLGPTGGYLLSYPIAAFVVGAIAHRGLSLGDYRDVSLPVLVGSMVVGTAVIYLLGIAGLMLALGMGPVEAFMAGAVAFIPAEAFKIAAAVGIVRSDAVAAA